MVTGDGVRIGPGYGILGCMEELQSLSPFKLAPYFSPRIWGFEDLSPWFDKKAAPGETPIGEAWLSGPESVVATGPFAGKFFAETVKENAEAILGQEFKAEGEYPLLIKVLFPREKLSVQVHPDDALAQQKGEARGKTECWYVLEAKPDANIALGLRPGVTADDVRRGIADQTLEEMVGWIPVEAGDMVYVDAGTVHAIWPGVVILETQQTSDTTYRMYDYGRPRELHVEESLGAMRTETRAGKIAPKKGAHGESVAVDEKYFRVERWNGDVPGLAEVTKGTATQLLFVVDGELRIQGEGTEPFTAARCELVVIPAAASQWTVQGTATVVRIVPQHKAEL